MTTPLRAETADLAEVTPETRRLVPNNLDLIRLFAASEVAVKHALNALGLAPSWLESIGIFPGVPIFFFISGFLIYQSYRNSGSLRTFATNRVYRLYPGLYLCLALGVGLAFVLGGIEPRDFATGEFWAWLAGQMSFVHFYNPGFLRDFGTGVLNGSLWTISVELEFYVLTPILAFLVLRWPAVWPFGLVISIAANLVLAAMPQEEIEAKLLMVTFLPWIYMFMVGAWLSSRPDVVWRIVDLPWWVIAGAFLAAHGLSWVLGLAVVGNGIGPIAFAAVVAVVLKAAYWRPATADRILRRNDISYGIYIYHMIAVNVALQLGFAVNWGAFAVVLAATAGLAILSWRLVERPALKAKPKTIHGV